MSFEPLSWDVSDVVKTYPDSLRWAVIGAASNGRTYYQPDPEHVTRLLEILNYFQVPVFFKGNLKGNPAAEPWREEFPQVESPF
jgi:protein gp37